MAHALEHGQVQGLLRTASELPLMMPPTPKTRLSNTTYEHLQAC